MEFYYLEKDGQLFLVEDKGVWRFPTKKEVPCPFTQLATMDFPQGTVHFCIPTLDKHPDHWTFKDDVPALEKVDPLVRMAVNRSLVRHASDAIIYRDGNVLMVKASRGLIPGSWDLPGGFITYSESPEQSLVREVKEETGLDIEVKELFHVATGIGEKSGHYFMVFLYLCDIVGGEIKPEPSEIEAVEWLPLNQAMQETKKLVFREALEKFKKTLERG